MIVDTNPALPDRHAAIAGIVLPPALRLAAMAVGLAAAGATPLAMPYNAANAFAETVIGATRLPFLDRGSRGGGGAQPSCVTADRRAGGERRGCMGTRWRGKA